MRSTPFVVAFVVWAGLGLASIGTAQTVAGPTIHNVTVHEGAGVLTITGTGFGREAVVILDGQPVPVLPGATATQIDVLAPAEILGTPGTYRLTVVDPVRKVGDAFVVASQAGSIVSGGLNRSATHVPVIGIAPAAAGSALTGAVVTGTRSLNGPAPLFIEDSGSPYRTALGYGALVANTTGINNTAAGYFALTTNSRGINNSAVGFEALRSNTDGSANTAMGLQALFSNSTGGANTATGLEAMYSNTTGDRNTANGRAALYSNTTGRFTTAIGDEALSHNTTGSWNTATGRSALSFNTTGDNNSALGFQAGYNAITGSYNLFLGAGVVGTSSDTNTIRIGLPYSGGAGQNRTFIAGIRDTALTGSVVPVYIDANGQLGTTPPAAPPGVIVPLQDATVHQQLAEQRAINADQRATIADLLARLARVEALLAPTATRK